MSDQQRVDDWDRRAAASRPGGEPLSPWVLVVVGAVVAAVGSPLVLADEVDDATARGLGLVLVWLGIAIAVVGLVAIGVMLGIRRQRWRDERG